MSVTAAQVPVEMESIFAPAERVVSEYFQTRTQDPARGTIEIGGERYVLLRGAALSVEFFSLMADLFGSRREAEAADCTRSLLYDLGHAVGMSDARSFHARMGLTDPIERLSVGPIHFSHAGWAFVRILPESRPSMDADYLMVFEHPHSIEADSWIKSGRVPDGPACILNAGYSAGWCSESFGMPLVTAEILCKARGEACCRFLMAPPDRIDEHVRNRGQDVLRRDDPPQPRQLFDLLSRKRAEENLRVSEEKLSTIGSCARDAIIMIDPKGAISYWNPAAEKMFGYGNEEALGRNLHAILVPERFREAHHKAFPTFQETGAGAAVGKTVELSGCRKDGTEFPLELSLSAVPAQGGWTAVGIARDISERKAAERALAESARRQVEVNQLQQDLLAPDSLEAKLTRLTDGIVRILGADFCRIWMARPGDRCDADCVHAAPPDGRRVCRSHDRCLHLLASSGRYTHLDGQAHRRVPIGCYKIGLVASGEHRKLLSGEVATDPCVHDHAWARDLGLVSFAGYQLRPPGGETIGVLALFSKHVITPDEDALLESLANTATQVIQAARADEEYRALQTQLGQAQRLESVGQLAAGIAHEINTPTQFVSDNTRFLQKTFPKLNEVLKAYERLLEAGATGPVPAELRAEVEAIAAKVKLDYLLEQIPEAIADSLEGLERVTRIVRAMKDFSHPGQQEMCDADLNHAIESTITVARNEWKYVADMVLDLDPSLPAVPCSLGDFNQVILNLVVNASHAISDVLRNTGQTKGTITVSTRQDGGQAEIRIQDTGTGIPERHRHKVFEHFFTTKEVGKGTGQGLAIARAVIVEKHGGTLTFETETGKGTTFIIRLPIGIGSGPGDEASDEKALCSVR